MYLHLGRDIVVMQEDIIGLFDLDSSTWSKHTKAFFTNCEQKGMVINVSDELPKSAIVCCAKNGNVAVYISQLSSRTLLKRSKEPIEGRQ